MKSIFESNNPFEDAFVNFDIIRSDSALLRFLIKVLSRPGQKTPLIWQMKGNQLCSAVCDAIENFNDDTDYTIVPKDSTPEEVLNHKDIHIYGSHREADSDFSSGFIIFNEFSGSNPSLRNFVLNIIKGTSKHYVPKNWRIICLANTDLGETFWKPEYKKLFFNCEYNPAIKNDNSELEDSKQEDNSQPNISEGFSDDTQFMSIDDAKEKIYTILYNALLKHEISQDEYVYIDEDGVIVDNESGFDPDMLYYARKADNFIDFDALSDGNVVIYTTPLYKFIEETFNKEKEIKEENNSKTEYDFYSPKCLVDSEGNLFKSYSEAAKFHNVSPNTVECWLLHPKFFSKKLGKPVSTARISVKEYESKNVPEKVKELLSLRLNGEQAEITPFADEPSRDEGSELFITTSKSSK